MKWCIQNAYYKTEHCYNLCIQLTRDHYYDVFNPIFMVGFYWTELHKIIIQNIYKKHCTFSLCDLGTPLRCFSSHNTWNTHLLSGTVQVFILKVLIMKYYIDYICEHITFSGTQLYCFILCILRFSYLSTYWRQLH